MEETHSKVVLEIEVVGGDVEDAVKSLRKQFDDFHKAQSKGSKQQHTQVKETQKLRDKSQSPQAMRTFLGFLNTRARKEKDVLRTLREQDKLYRRIAQGGRGALGLGPMGMFGGRGGMFGRGGMSMNRMFGGMGMRGMMGGMGRMGMGMMRMLGPAALLAMPFLMGGKFIAGATASKIQAGHSMHMQEQRSLAGLAGLGTSQAAMYRAQERGSDYGFGPMDTLQQARSAALQTGNARSVNTMQMFARATGMDVGQLTGLSGSMARGGTQFSGQMHGPGVKALERVYANAFSTGLDKSRFHEVYTGVGRLVENVNARMGGDVDSSRISDMFGLLGSTGESGLMGARGAAVLQRMDQAIRSPGGGEHGQALMMQAFGFGRPGGNATYYEAMKRQQQGIYGKNNLQDLFAETSRQYGGGQEQIMALSRMTGADYDVLEKLRGAIQTGSGMEGMNEDEKKEYIDSLMAKAGGIEQEALHETKGMSDKLSQMVEHQLDTLKAGRLTSQRLLSIQELTNDLIRGWIPIGEKLLGVVEMVYSFMVRMFGDDSEKKRHAAQQQKQIRSDVAGGVISKKEGIERLEELRPVLDPGSKNRAKGKSKKDLLGTTLSPKARLALKRLQGHITDTGEYESGSSIESMFKDIDPETRQKLLHYKSEYGRAARTRDNTKDDAEVRKLLVDLIPILNELAKSTQSMAASSEQMSTASWNMVDNAFTNAPVVYRSQGPRWSDKK